MLAQHDSLYYTELTARNAGYLSSAAQELMRTRRLLIAGCGVGSTVAEAAVRMGFTRLTLVDGDAVSVHNLNRQTFEFADVGSNKAAALAKRLRAINPAAELTACESWVTPQTAPGLVAGVDMVVDTIDFLSLSGIVALHDECRRQGRPVVSAMGAGWGAGAMYFPPDGKHDFRSLMGLPASGPVADKSYVEHFMGFVGRIAPHLNPAVVAAMRAALGVMKDGAPCPASQLSAGNASVAALVVTMLARLLKNEPVTPAPRMILADFDALCAGVGADAAA